MSIEFILDSESIIIDEKNFSDSMQKLENALTPNKLVLVQNYTITDLGGIGPKNPVYDNKLFFCDGIEDKEFVIRKGKKNYTYISLNDITDNNYKSYRIIDNWAGKKIRDLNIIIPSFWFGTAFNENTFSSGGSTSWTTRHAAGTERVIVGDKLLEMFPDAINALQFAQNAQYFRLSGAYIPSFHSIRSKSDRSDTQDSFDITNLKTRVNELPDIVTRSSDKETYSKLRKEISINDIDETHKRIREMICLNAVLNLLYEPVHNSDIYGVELYATQIGFFRKGLESIKNEGYPVDSEDYLIGDRISNKRIAFVKIDKGNMYNETYILPAKNKEDIVSAAFSEENVKKFYPIK